MQKANISNGGDSYGSVILVSCSSLRDHPLRPASFDELYLQELAYSIARHGMLNPLLVRPLSDDYWQIIAGHYRMRAVLKLRWSMCPVMVIDCDDITAKMLLATSNSSGRYFSAIEEGLIIHNLHEQDKLDFNAIGKLFKKSKSWVSRRLALVLSLEEDVRDDVQKGLLKARTAQEIALLPRGNQSALAQCVKKHQLSKDETAILVQVLKDDGFNEQSFCDCFSNPRIYLQKVKKSVPEKIAAKTERPTKGNYGIDLAGRTLVFLERLNIFLNEKADDLSKEDLKQLKSTCAKLNFAAVQFSKLYFKLFLKT